MFPTSGPSKGQSIHINPNFKPTVKLPLPTSTHINPLFIRPPTITQIHMNPEFLKAQQEAQILREVIPRAPVHDKNPPQPQLNKIISKSRTHIVRAMPALKKPQQQLKETTATDSRKQLLLLTKRKLIRAPMTPVAASNCKSTTSISEILNKRERLKTDHKTSAIYPRADIVPILKRRQGAFVARYALRRSNSLKKSNLYEVSQQPKGKKPDASVNSVNRKLRLININGILYKSMGNKLQRKIDGGNTTKQQLQQKLTIQSDQARSNSLKSMTSKIGGLDAKSSKNPIGRTLYVRGAKYIMDPTGFKLTRTPHSNDSRPISVDSSNKFLKFQAPTSSSSPAMVNRTLRRRIDIGGVTYIASGQSGHVFLRTNTHLVLAHLQQAKQRSVHVLRRTLTKTNKPCLIFQRLGKCAALERNKCSKVHDKQRIIVCPKFLQGLCFDSDCLLSHNNTLEKMPVCRFFLQGSCVRTDCPYLHKKLNDDSEICEDFRRGFCALAEQCNKQHIFSKAKSKVASSHDSHEPFPKAHDISSTETTETTTTPATDNIVYRYFNGDGFLLGATEISKEIAKPECSITEDRPHDAQQSATSEESADEGQDDNGSIPKRKRKHLDPLPAFIPLS